MSLQINEVYRLNIGEDIELESIYEYLVCVAEKEDYYILHPIKEYCILNGLDYTKIDDIDEYFSDKEELDFNHYKKFNNLESLYYKDKVVENTKITIKRKFNIV